MLGESSQLLVAHHGVIPGSSLSSTSCGEDGLLLAIKGAEGFIGPLRSSLPLSLPFDHTESLPSVRLFARI